MGTRGPSQWNCSSRRPGRSEYAAGERALPGRACAVKLPLATDIVRSKRRARGVKIGPPCLLSGVEGMTPFFRRCDRAFYAPAEDFVQVPPPQGEIHIRKIRADARSRLYSPRRMPVPAPPGGAPAWGVHPCPQSQASRRTGSRAPVTTGQVILRARSWCCLSERTNRAGVSNAALLKRPAPSRPIDRF